ncbi:MAG: acetyl-CoA carboxylase biotin carboxyl carrier protein [Phycisphaerales bacterium]|nr:acetyl-CoA carboxylase biotin carboxyl carrier protein [Phycisphaerales bacterium]
MIDIRKLKELVKLMVANDLTELDLRDPEEQVTLRRPNQWTATPAAAAPPPAPVAQAPAPPQAPAAAAPAAPVVEEAVAPADANAGLVAVPSPMVGTFYSSPSPDADPFVTVGASVSPDSVVCMVEAMKIFNEIKADVSGTIEQVCVANGDAVEFGQDLFLVRPA